MSKNTISMNFAKLGMVAQSRELPDEMLTVALNGN